MDVLLVRHAIACERDVQRWPDDRERPLSRRGVRRARQAAAALRYLAEPPARVLTSPLLRARQTAAILAQDARWPKAAVCPQLEPGSAAHALFEVLGSLRARRVALIGHQPDLGELLARCLRGQVDGRAFGFRKMGVALVSFEAAARAGAGELRWLAPPKVLRAAHAAGARQGAR